MLLVVLGALLGAALADCDISSVSEDQKAIALRLCHVEQQVEVLENAMQELLQRADLVVPSTEDAVPQKRKNEFIRFGKRSATNEKRKNEFIRFGKRKNEFIRFGRSDPSMALDDYSLEKRKNEFIRFG